MLTVQERIEIVLICGENTSHRVVANIFNERHSGKNMQQSTVSRIMALKPWNVRSLHGKECELISEFEETGLTILCISETKMKAQWERVLDDHILLTTSNISRWEAVSERVLVVELKDSKEKMMTIISVYGPNDNDKSEEKDKFWEELTLTSEDVRGTLFIAGDFNSRVGKNNDRYKAVLGQHREETRNDNGKRMLDFCLNHRLLVTNSFFKHKDIHKYTRVQHNKGEHSIIDYVLT
ncbi:endonuclease/exonuclease/phosphatase superfamily [Holotrichia oblita]|uniref:Endonuclease/exonuclease/phosphatase superfamily n=1 Tax=Holotrichia oblita TaxID=644536 RepID=A0ACB9TQX3_HOLOL|nr:endonuclease/exonuclease/phosphatase superfamily [Holotrichia oblita]